MGTFQDPQTGDWYMGPDRSDARPDVDLLSRGIVKDPFSDDYYQVPASSIGNWRPRQPIAAPMAPEPTVADGVGLADYAKSVMAGGAQLVQGVGWAARMLGSEDIGGTVEDLGRDAVDYWNEGLSDAAKDALSREFVSKNEAGEWEWGDATLHTVGLFGAQSLLGTAAGAGAGAGITKVLQAFANPVGRGVLLQAARAGSEQALKKLSLVDKVIGAAGFGLGEGTVGGMSAGVNVYDRVMQMTPEDLVSNERYQQVFNSTDETMPELERHQYAAETVAREASSLAGLQAGLTTALLGAPAGAYFGSLLGRSGIAKIAGGRLKEMTLGAAGEAAQEFAQGAAEQVIGNKALQGAGADVDTWDDVLNQALGGALAGAPLGAALGSTGGGAEPAKPGAKPEAKGSTPKRYLDPIREAANAAVAKGAPQPDVLKIVKDVADGTEPVLTGAGKLRKMAMGAPAVVSPEQPVDTANRGTSAESLLDVPGATQSLEGSGQDGAGVVLPEVSRGLHADDSPDAQRTDARGQATGERAGVRQGVPTAGQAGTDAVRAVRQPGKSDASRRLQPAAAGAVDVPGVSPDASLPGKDGGARSALKITPDETLKGENKAIESRLVKKIQADPEAAEREYAAIKGAQGGKLLNTDLARELSPDYLKDRKVSNAVHEPSSALVKWMYERRLTEQPQTGDLPEVLFTAGGTGAGKTTGLRAAEQMNPDVGRAQIIYDTNMNGAKSSIQKIEQALAAGKTARVIYTYREPVDALVNGALGRASRQTAKFGSGRTVPLTAHAETHVGARDTLEELQERYKGDPRVRITVIDNSVKGQPKEVDLSSIPRMRYDQVLEQLNGTLDQEFAAGRLTEPVYRAFRGDQPGPQVAGQAGSARPDDQLRLAEGPAEAGAGRGRPAPLTTREAAAPSGVPESAGAPAAQPLLSRAAESDFDEDTSAKPVAAGRPFLAFRVADREGLDGVNAGDAMAVSDFLARLEDFERPQPVGAERSDAVYVNVVAAPEGFGQFSRQSQGRAMDAEDGKVGRAAGFGSGIRYSFPKGGKHQVSRTVRVPIEEVRDALQKAYGTRSFDEVGTIAGSKVLMDVARSKLSAADTPVTPKPKPMLRRGSGQGGQDAARVREQLRDFIDGISPLVNVQVWDSPGAASWFADPDMADPGDLPSSARGAFLGPLGRPTTVQLYANNLKDAETAQRVAVHEVFGHLAMERYVFGRNAIDAVKAQLGKGWVQEEAARIRGIYGDLTDTDLAKEVIAHAAERGDKPLLITRLIGEIRKWLRSMGVKLDYSEGDIRELIARSARALRAEALKTRRLSQKLEALRPNASDADIGAALDEWVPPGVTAVDRYLDLRGQLDALREEGGQPADVEQRRADLREAIEALENRQDQTGTLRLSRGPADQTQTDAFKRWFGDSKVVDESGRPLVVYHGTSGMRDDMRDQGSVAQFDEFDPKKRGAVSRSSDAKAGFWFASSQDRAWMAGRDAAMIEQESDDMGYDYKSHVLSTYLKISNPLVLDDISDYSPAQVARIAKKAKADGHDGLIFTKGENPPELRLSGGTTGSDYLVFEPTQIKSATDNRGTFDPANPSILFSRAATADPAVQAILDRVMVKPPEALTMKDRARGLWQKLTDVTGVELKQGLIDSFASIEAMERDFTGGAMLDASQSAHKAALATKNLPSQMAAVMLKGVPVWKDGVYQVAPGRKGVIEIFEPLTKHKDGNLLQQWEGYAAARRASRLIKEKNPDGTPREQLFTPVEIAQLMALDQKYPEFKTVFDEWQGFNKDMLDLAQDAGVLDPESRKLWERNDYVPFYRAVDAISERTGPRNKRGLANQRADIKRLGGSDKQLGNVFENMMMNTAHLLDASNKNRAMQRIVGLGIGTALEPVPLQSEAVKISDDQLARALSAAGLIVGNLQTDPYGVTVVQKMTPAQKEHWSTLFRKVAPKGGNIVSVMEQGKPQYFEVTDPLVLQSIAGMGYDNYADVFGLFRGSKKLLTNAITADPAFMLANFVRDTLSNWVISDTSVRPITDAIKGIKATLANDPDLIQLMMAGAGGGGFYDSSPEDIRKLIASKVPANQQRLFMDSVVGPKNIWAVWRKVGASAENANRIATFRRVLANGGTVAEAAYQARDVLNFSMAGDYAAIRWMTQSVPFLNARIQGLYRLYRGARDNKKAFFIKGTMLAAATMALVLKNDDDERYEELPDWDKDTYWHFWAGEEHFRIPKPFEVGALFSTIPERAYRTVTGRDSFKLLGKRLFAMFADTFAFNPTPQLVKPIIEQYANRSMFTDSPIVGMAEQNLQPEAQYTPWTSETMRALADAMPDFAPAWLRSPRRLEAAVRAYTGALGMYALAGSDAAVRTALGYPPEPSRKIYDLPVVGRFWKDPDPKHTRYADQMYEMLDEANAVSATVNRMTRERRFEEAAELREANKGKLAVRVRLNRLGEQVRKINNQVRLIQLDRNLDGDTKRARIDALVERKNAVTREVARYSDVF